MQKLRTTLIALICFALCTGCSHQPDRISTIAVPLTDDEISPMGYAEECYDYTGENVLSYEKKDGEKVIYIYSAPIEYSYNQIVSKEDHFEAEGSYFKKIFPKSLSSQSPIVIGGDDNYAKIFMPDGIYTAEQKEQRNIFGMNQNAITYKDAFGKGMDYICYPTSFGVNTEIKLMEKPEQNKLTIKLQLPDLSPEISAPDYILFKSVSNGAVQSILYTPMVSDSKGNWSYANAVILLNKDSSTNTYTVEYTIDEAFLNDKATKYPITMNQSIHLYKSKQPDTSAYENTGDLAGHYLSPYMLLGDSTLKGEGWTYIRYETLNGLDIDPDKIISAKYVFHNLFDLEKETKVSAYAVTSDWCSINTRWFNRPPYDKRMIGEVCVMNPGDYSIDITPLIKEIIKNKTKPAAIYSIKNSFFIKSETSDSNLCISAGDNGLFSPYLEMIISE